MITDIVQTLKGGTALNNVVVSELLGREWLIFPKNQVVSQLKTPNSTEPTVFKKSGLGLYVHPTQRRRGGIIGHDLKLELTNQFVAGVDALLAFLKYPNLIPPE